MAKTLIKVDKQTDLAASQYAEGVTAAIAAVQSDVDGNEADVDAAIAAEAAARAAADTNLQGNIDKEVTKLKVEGNKEITRIGKEGDMYAGIVNAFSF